MRGAAALGADVVIVSDEIRNTIITWAKAKGTIDPAQFASVDWKLTREGTPVF